MPSADLLLPEKSNQKKKKKQEREREREPHLNDTKSLVYRKDSNIVGTAPHLLMWSKVLL